MARRRASTVSFEAIAIEGAFLATDMLARIAAIEATEQTEADYDTPPGLKLRDEIGRYYRIGEALWATFDRLRERDQGGVVTANFVAQLLVKVFGFSTLTPSEPPTIAGRTFPVRYSALEGRVPFVIAPAPDGIDRGLPQFGDTQRRRSATLLLQDLLNASDDRLFGLVTDGSTLRVMRNNVSMTRPAWIEADLERIFAHGLFADFSALWLLIHQSRFGKIGSPPSDCALERWREKGREQGVTARDRLRDGVEEALKVLGEGFLHHRDNTALVRALETDELNAHSYFQELLRTVYRFIFLFTAEDRGLLRPKEQAETPQARLYAEGYSLARLRTKTVRSLARDRHHDLWDGVRIIFRGLARGEKRLALPALGGLFAPDRTPHLDGARIENVHLLAAIDNLAWIREEGSRVRINWRDMETEELGSVYESLLELTPCISALQKTFSFAESTEAEGHERKKSGSYYTPDSLVQLLLDSALDPVIEETVTKNPGREADALLDLDIIDPAAGSGHFLLAAARRLAGRIAQLRSPGSPSAEDYRHALREVARHSLYGVDRNPLAVELCKVALWIETVEPGKPLSFLDGRIREGDSLIGVFDLAALADGIPDGAYKPFAGDDKAVARYYASRNRKERENRPSLPFAGSLALLTRAARVVAEMPEDEVAEIEKKVAAFRALATRPEAWQLEIACDLFVAAYFAPKTGGLPDNPNTVTIPTTDHLWRKLNGQQLYPPLEAAAIDVAREVRAFHWPLAFPEVSAKGGFDCVLGNPPWVRQELLTSIKKHLSTFAAFSSTADSSVYFLERSIQITRPSGRIALLTPNKWFRAAYGENLRRMLRERSRLDLLVDFGHSRNLFPDADTFPAAISVRPVLFPIPDSETFRFVRAHDDDRERYTLSELITQHAVAVDHGSLRPDGWRLENSAANDLLARLTATGQPLEIVLRGPMLSGLKTGLNRAFYVNTSLRNAMVRADPISEPLFKRFLRGRDVKRWVPVWDDQWHIVIPSSQNRTWPWSSAADEASAEATFAATYPTIYAHLKQFEYPLRARQDRGQFWWELRACDYYGVFEEPKIVVQCIAYYSQFALDDRSYYVNNKAIIIPTNDLYILAILNSRLTWWIINRTFQHMKDEGISVDVQFLKRLPVPPVSAGLRSDISRLTGSLITADRLTLQDKATAALEAQLNDLVERAFALTDSERRVMLSSLPPRDPIDVVQRKYLQPPASEKVA